MLPEIGASELLVIAVVALIVVGPKDLPVLLRKLGQFMSKLRGMASEFRASFDEMARQSELDDLRKEVEAMRRGQLGDVSALQADVSQTFNDIHHDLNNPADAYWPGAYDYSEPAPGPVTIEKVDPPKRARARKSPAKAGAGEGGEAKSTVKKAPARKPAAPRKPKPPAEPGA